jgi:hypothetical protein
MRLNVVYYSKGDFYRGYIEGSQFSWSYSTSHRITDLSRIKEMSKMYIPIKRYMELYMKDRYFMNEISIKVFIDRTKDYLRADGVWVNDSVSVTGGGVWN